MLGSSFLTAVLTLSGDFFINRLNDQRSRHRRQSYAALRIAVGLEEFAGKCAERIGIYEMDHGPSGGPTELPVFLGYPQELAWDEINIALADEALSFENSIRAMNASLAGTSLTFGSQMAAEQAVDGCIELGSRAWAVAVSVRQRHGLHDVSNHLPWDFPSLLRRHSAVLEGRKQVMREARDL